MTVRCAARTLREYILFYVCLLYFGVFGVALSIASVPLYHVLPQAQRSRFGRWIIGVLFRGFLWLARLCKLGRLDLSALDALRGERGILIAPNHPCLLDAVFVIAHVPDVACIMKAEIWDNVVLGGGSRLAGYIRNDSTISMVRRSAKALREGSPLLVFPEGTRTRRGQVNEFKGGFALIAKRARAPIQTVFIETDSPFLSKGWPLLRKPRFPILYRARLGRRFTVDGDLKVFMHDLQTYYREELAALASEEPSPVLHPAGSPRPGPAA
ncbi:MAG TPA: lysophospholipid acyltransferase family protein [Burkholderiales bacterium]|nr:lysophospholipid acyltransferase family protein [Burkholderiales bacterium]